MDDFQDELRAAVEAYDFREVHPNLRVGTASDREAGWLGQIYDEETWAGAVTTRARKLSTGSFEERILPIESVAEYFEHFAVLELDFTYYRPLLTPDGAAEKGLGVLRQYADHAPPDALFLLKAPGQFFSRTLRRQQEGRAVYTENPGYLDAPAYTAQFHAPALDLLGERLVGVVFEQEYGRKEDAPAPEAFVDGLDGFFGALPTDVQPHLEIRSPHLLTPAYFDFLEARGLGHVFAHWQWLPPIREQWTKIGGRITAADGNVVARYTSPLRMSFEESYALAHPFEAPVPEWEASPDTQRLVLDAVALLYQCERQDAMFNLVVNNRVYGNAPALAQRIARRVLDEEAKRDA